MCGDKSGSVGVGLGKAKEVPIAIKKAIDKANKSFIRINLYNNTMPHVVEGKFRASKVIIKPAGKGTGVIAGGALRVILEALGVKNVVGKSYGSRNPINLALAALTALKTCKNIDEEIKERGVKIPFRVKGLTMTLTHFKS